MSGRQKTRTSDRFEQLIAALESGPGVSRVGLSKLQPPLASTANGYIKFAEDDLEKGDTRSLVNSLSNAKRAIECQMDTLLVTRRNRK